MVAGDCSSILFAERIVAVEIIEPSPADHRAEPGGPSKPSFSCSCEARTESAGSFPRSAFLTVWRFPSTQRTCFLTRTSLGPRPPFRMAQLLLSGGKQPTARLGNAQAPVLIRPWPVKEELPVTAQQKYSIRLASALTIGSGCSDVYFRLIRSSVTSLPLSAGKLSFPTNSSNETHQHRGDGKCRVEF